MLEPPEVATTEMATVIGTLATILLTAVASGLGTFITTKILDKHKREQEAENRCERMLAECRNYARAMADAAAEIEAEEGPGRADGFRIVFARAARDLLQHAKLLLVEIGLGGTGRNYAAERGALADLLLSVPELPSSREDFRLVREWAGAVAARQGSRYDRKYFIAVEIPDQWAKLQTSLKRRAALKDAEAEKNGDDDD